MGEKGEGSGGKGGGNWEWGTPLSTPSVLLLFRHYISHKITFGAPSSGGVLCSACGAFISMEFYEGIISLYRK